MIKLRLHSPRQRLINAEKIERHRVKGEGREPPPANDLSLLFLLH